MDAKYQILISINLFMSLFIIDSASAFDIIIETLKGDILKIMSITQNEIQNELCI